MNTFSFKLTALAASVVANGVIMGAVGFLFEIQSHPHLAALSFARQLAMQQWTAC